RRLPVFGNRSIRDCEVKLLAYLIGDGGLTGTTPKFTNTNPAIQRDFCSAVADFGGVRARALSSCGRAPSWAVVADHEAMVQARGRFAQSLDMAIGACGRPARALARETGVAPASVSYWRRGRMVPDEQTLMRLAGVLAVEPDGWSAQDAA